MSNVNVSDNIEAKENLVNHKPWFNGMKTFSSVKVVTPPRENVLKVFVVDEITSDSGLA